MAGVPGSVVVPVLQGRRPLLVEVQALLGPGTGGGRAARPQTLGIDAGRANLLMAVLACRTAVDVPGRPSCSSPPSAASPSPSRRPTWPWRWPWRRSSPTVPSPPDVVVFGELGLAGEVRTVPGADRRLAEAHRPASPGRSCPPRMPARPAAAPPGMAVHGVRTLAEALQPRPDRGRSGARPGTMPAWSTVTAAASH